MPIYAYKCSACGHAQDVLRKMSDPLLTDCPECGQSTYIKQVTAAGFQLKGSGWYVTDFRNNGGGAPGTPAAGKPAADTSAEGTPATAASAASTTDSGKSASSSGDSGAASSTSASAPAPSAAPATPASPAAT